MAVFFFCSLTPAKMPLTPAEIAISPCRYATNPLPIRVLFISRYALIMIRITFQMAQTSKKDNRNTVKTLWRQGWRSATKISRETGISLHSCKRYVTLLRKNGNIPENSHVGKPRKISPKMCRQIGRIINLNHFVTAAEIKTQLEKT